MFAVGAVGETSLLQNFKRYTSPVAANILTAEKVRVPLDLHVPKGEAGRQTKVRFGAGSSHTLGAAGSSKL